MPPPAFLTGVLSGFTKAASESRRLAREDQAAQDKREIEILQQLQTSDKPHISLAATTGLLDIASGQKKPKGGYLARLMGPSEVSIHPAVSSLMQLIQGGERTEIPAPTLGSMSVGPAPSPAGTLPTPPPAAGAAAMPPPPNKPGGGITPPTGGPVALPGGGVASSAQPIQVGAPPEIIPVSNTPDLRAPTGGPPLRFGSTGQPAGPPTVIRTPMQVWDTPEQKVIKAARAKWQGELEAKRTSLEALGATPEQVRQALIQDIAGASRSGGARDSYAEGPTTFNSTTGQWEQLLYNRYDPTDRIYVPAPAPGTTGSSAPNEAARTAKELFGARYPQFANDPNGLMRSLTPQEAAQLDATLRSRGVTQVGREGLARGQAQIATELGMPIGVPAATSLGDDPTKPLGALAGTTATRPMPDTDVQKLADFQNGLDEADTLAATLAGIQSTGARAKLGVMLPNVVSEFTGWGVSAKQRQAVIARVKQIIGKALEDGVLRKEDEIKYKDILPEISDPQEVAASKLLGLKAALMQQKRTHENTLRQAGYRVGGGPTPPPAGPGAAPPPPPSTPKVGDFVGATEYTGEVRYRDGQPVGLVGGKVVELAPHPAKPNTFIVK